MAPFSALRRLAWTAGLCGLWACTTQGPWPSDEPADASGSDPVASPPSSSPPPTISSAPLQRATAVAVPLPPATVPGPHPLQASLHNWRGQRAHLAGTAHYDQGEWIYEDYPLTAYGAAQPGSAPLYELLDQLGDVHSSADRLPGGMGFFIPQAGAGPLVEEADVAELRFSIRGDDLYLLARTTTMHAPVRTALLLLLDTGRSGESYSVPFGTGLQTSQTDTAVLITAEGSRIVDLATGMHTDAPTAANAEGYFNALETRLPLAALRLADAPQIRFVAASGLVEPGQFELAPGGAAGPLAKVLPRFQEPVQSVHDRQQALALAAGNIDAFLTTVSGSKLRAGESEYLLPGVGYSVRTFEAPEEISLESGINGSLRQYGLYIPAHRANSDLPATLLLRGSGMTGHSLAAITPGLFQNLGDQNGAIVISPSGRSDADFFQGAVYRDVLQALDDAQALLPIDANRITVAGYSMGGYATYMFAATQPDRFAGAFVIEGLVGGNQPATILYPPADVLPLLYNLEQMPVEIYQGDLDANVPLTHGLAASTRLQNLGYRYRLDLLPANTHFTPGILNDYSIGARYLRPLRRTRAPARVRLVRSMPYENSVDTAIGTDQPGGGPSHGLRFDHAWFVHDLQAKDPHSGTARVDVRSLARPEGLVVPVRSQGIEPGPVGGQPLSIYQEQSWEMGPLLEPTQNALAANLEGVARVRLDLADMGLTLDAPLKLQLISDSETTLVLDAPPPVCVRPPTTATLQFTQREDAIDIGVPVGEHILQLLPC